MFLGTLSVNVACSTLFVDNFTGPKWVLFHVFSLACFVFALFSGRVSCPIRVPKLSPLTKAVSGLALVSALISVALNGPRCFIWPAYTLAAWGGLVFLTAGLFQTSPGYFNAFRAAMTATSVITVAFALLQALKIKLFVEILGSVGVGSSVFGNPNFAADIIGVAALFQIYEWRGARTLKRKIFFGLILAGSLIFFGAQHNRGAAAALAFSALVWCGQRLRGKKFVLYAVGTLLVSATFYLVTTHNPDKLYSQAQRIVRWENTLSLINDHPFGAGPGSFEDRYLDYYRGHGRDTEVNEFTILLHPHNEYLRLAVEYGWAAGLAVIAAALYQIFLFASAADGLSMELSVCDAGIAFVAVESCFNGTLYNPSLLAILGLCLAFRLGRTSASRLVPPSEKYRLLALAVVGLLVGGGFAVAKASEARVLRVPEPLSEFSCRFYPSIWRNCLRLGKREFDAGQADKARATFESMLIKNPNNFSALKHLAFVKSKIGDHRGACESFRAYLDLFDHVSQFAGLYADYCQATPR